MDVTDKHKKDLEGSKAGRLVKKLKTVEGHNTKFPGFSLALRIPDSEWKKATNQEC